MGTATSVESPPSYSSATKYKNRKQLKWALKTLTKPPENLTTWLVAYSIACANIAEAHGLRPRNPQRALDNAGIIAIHATAVLKEVKRGTIIHTDCFAVDATRHYYPSQGQ